MSSFSDSLSKRWIPVAAALVLFTTTLSIYGQDLPSAKVPATAIAIYDSLMKTAQQPVRNWIQTWGQEIYRTKTAPRSIDSVLREDMAVRFEGQSVSEDAAKTLSLLVAIQAMKDGDTDFSVEQQQLTITRVYANSEQFKIADRRIKGLENWLDIMGTGVQWMITNTIPVSGPMLRKLR